MAGGTGAVPLSPADLNLTVATAAKVLTSRLHRHSLSALTSPSGEGRFALGGEIGVLKPVTNQYAVTRGLASVTPAFHFISRDSKRKFDPFEDGGLSLLVGRGGAVAIHYGGGMNYWLRRRIGLRFEFRHHIWSIESGRPCAEPPPSTASCTTGTC